MVFYNKEDGIFCLIGVFWSFFCRYVMEGFDGVCLLLEDDGVRD